MTLRLIGIGTTGLMLSPCAKHLKHHGPARFVRVFDRGNQSERHQACRAAWQQHGAAIVSDYTALLAGNDYDGVVICAGKNGDDCNILKAVLAQLSSAAAKRPFILHLSTVSSAFTLTAQAHCASRGIDYVNYPLTGGPLGAEMATMLILASGDKALYERLLPTLNTIGQPEYFGHRVSAGAEVKLIGQLMVFSGLTGIASAAALKSECFQAPLSGPSPGEFFDFLNNGAGGTRQWDVALSKGIRDEIWDQGFMIHHAAVDAIYTASLCQQRGLPAISIMPMLSIALAFAYLMQKHPGKPLATHAIAREMLTANAAGIDAFLAQHIDYNSIEASINNCIDALPEAVKNSVRLDINQADFS